MFLAETVDYDMRFNPTRVRLKLGGPLTVDGASGASTPQGYV